MYYFINECSRITNCYQQCPWIYFGTELYVEDRPIRANYETSVLVNVINLKVHRVGCLDFFFIWRRLIHDGKPFPWPWDTWESMKCSRMTHTISSKMSEWLSKTANRCVSRFHKSFQESKFYTLFQSIFESSSPCCSQSACLRCFSKSYLIWVISL